MDPETTDLSVADVVISLAGRDVGSLFYVIQTDGKYLMLANGKDRTIDKPKRKNRLHTKKVLRSETRVAESIRLGDKVRNSELRRDLAFISRELQSRA